MRKVQESEHNSTVNGFGKPEVCTVCLSNFFGDPCLSFRHFYSVQKMERLKEQLS